MKTVRLTFSFTILAITAIVIAELAYCRSWESGWLFVFYGIYKKLLQ